MENGPTQRAVFASLWALFCNL